MDDYKVSRGDIFWVDKFGFQSGSEQRSGRPAVIVSNDMNNQFSNTVEIVYLTTKPKEDLPTHVSIRSSRELSIALCEQITSVDKSRLGDYISACNADEMQMIDIALLTSIGVEPPPPAKENKPKEKTVEKKTELPASVAKVDTDCTRAERDRAIAERDTYKEMYEKLLCMVVQNSRVSV